MVVIMLSARNQFKGTSGSRAVGEGMDGVVMGVGKR